MRVDQPDDQVRIAIEDTGRGIPPELMRQIDKPFFSTKPDFVDNGRPLIRAGGRCRFCSPSRARTFRSRT